MVISRLEDERHNILPANNDYRKGYLKAIELALYLVKDIKEEYYERKEIHYRMHREAVADD